MTPLTFVLCLLVVALAYFALSYKIKRRRLETLGEKLPGPKSYPILGNSLLFAGVNNAKDLFDVGMSVLDENIRDFGSVWRIWMGPLLVVCVCDLENINTLLTSPHASTKHWWYVRLLNFMSTGLFGLNGKDWQDFRKSLMRYFPIKEIESFMGIFEAKALQLVSKFEKRLGTGVVNIHDLVKFFVLDIVCITHLGAEDMNETDENRHDFHHHLEKSLEITFTRALKPQYLLDCIYDLTPMGKENVRVDYEITGICRRIVQQRLDILESRGIDLRSDFEEEYYTDAVIKRGAQEGWDLQRMALFITDIVVGGSDTTALALAYTLMCLAMHPEYQERAYQEQLDIFGDSDRPPTFKEAHQGMPYLTMCYREALRLHGPIGIARELTADVQLGEHLLPEGAAVFLLFQRVHSDPKWFPRAKEFYPEHFSPDACNQRPKISFFPFSHGTRGCPGSLYSHVSGKMLLSLLIRKFRFTSPLKYSELKFKYSLMVENLDGYPVEIHRRSQREYA